MVLLLFPGSAKGASESLRHRLADQFGVRELVFAERAHSGHGKINDGHWYANLGYYARDPRKKAYASGGSLRKLDVVTGKSTALLEDPAGTFRDPAVHYDGKTILFSYRESGTAQFHLYEIQSDGSGLKQLTFGIYDDIEPCWLPDDAIIFVSGRARRFVNCWVTQVATLYTCDRDGHNIRQISANVEHDNTPCVLHDGRVVFQRWEYVDRSQVHYHHLWSVNPDGTGQMVYYGNMRPGGVFIDPQPIPDSDRIVFIHSPGHGRAEHAGTVCTVADRFGPDATHAVRVLNKSGNLRDPWALSETDLLAAIQDTKALHDSDPRWDTPGWKAPPEYIREMKRHGILPEKFNRETDPLNPHETDKRYWHAVTGHHLPGEEPKLHANPTIRSMCLNGTLTPDGNEFKPDSASLSTGKPATCSTALAAHPAHLANDGVANGTDSYWAMNVRDGTPAWWQVDLERPVHITCEFGKREVRYIRVTQTSNSANTGRHLVEVMAFE